MPQYVEILKDGLVRYEGKELQETIYEFTEIYPEVVLSVVKYSHEDLFKRIITDEIELAGTFTMERSAGWMDLVFEKDGRWINDVVAFWEENMKLK